MVWRQSLWSGSPAALNLARPSHCHLGHRKGSLVYSILISMVCLYTVWCGGIVYDLGHLLHWTLPGQVIVIWVTEKAHLYSRSWSPWSACILYGVVAESIYDLDHMLHWTKEYSLIELCLTKSLSFWVTEKAHLYSRSWSSMFCLYIVWYGTIYDLGHMLHSTLPGQVIVI